MQRSRRIACPSFLLILTALFAALSEILDDFVNNRRRSRDARFLRGAGAAAGSRR